MTENLVKASGRNFRLGRIWTEMIPVGLQWNHILGKSEHVLVI